jgi:ribosomal protein S27E
VRIIKQGQVKLYRLTCEDCMCEFECFESEMKRISDQREGNYLTITCPSCKTQVTRGADAGR